MGDHLFGIVAILLEQIDQRIGCRIVIFRRLLARFLAHPVGHPRADRPQGHRTLGERRRLGIALGQHRLAALPAQHVGVAHQLVDEIKLARLRGAQNLARQHQLHRIDRPGLADRTAGSGKAGKNPQIDFRKTQLGPIVIDRNAVVTRQRELQPAAHTEPRNAANERDLEILDPLEHRVGALECLGQNGRIAHLVEFGNVGACNKARFSRKQDNTCQGARLAEMFDMADQCFKFGNHVPAEHVDRIVLNVQRQPADLLDID